MIFWNKRKIFNFDPYNAFLAIATNIPVLLMTDFVIQGHKYCIYPFYKLSSTLLIGIRSEKGRQLHFKASMQKQTWKETWGFGEKNKRLLGHSSELVYSWDILQI